MEALLILVTAIATLITVDFAAVRWGADSRETIGDDHGR